MLEVLEAGLLSTIQDAGRPEWTHLGVPIGGACDPWSLAVANLLVGNDPGAAALEMTLAGPVLAVGSDIVIGVAGADLGGVDRASGRPLAPGRTHRLAAGATVAFPGGAEGRARAYLSVAGGFDVPAVLGSRSTTLAGGFGGLDGRPLRPGDRLVGAPPAAGLAIADLVWPALPDDKPGDAGGEPVRVVRGPAEGVDELIAREWTVASGSDRVGLRLEGPPIARHGAGAMLSHGVVFGAVQLPPDGLPIVLLADHQTTGGYPVPAVVISVDRPRIGQLRPGATVTFVEVDEPTAVAALARQRTALRRGATLLREAVGWDDLWRSAGG
jgi:antagonist of KipI